MNPNTKPGRIMFGILTDSMVELVGPTLRDYLRPLTFASLHTRLVDAAAEGPQAVCDELAAFAADAQREWGRWASHALGALGVVDAELEGLALGLFGAPALTPVLMPDGQEDRRSEQRRIGQAAGARLAAEDWWRS